MQKLSRAQGATLLLRNQSLLQRSTTADEALRAVFAVQTQYAGSLIAALVARVKKMPKGWEAKALVQDSDIVKSWSLRHTLHVHRKDDHAMAIQLFGKDLSARYLTWLGHESPEELFLEIEAALDEGPLTRKELHAKVPWLTSLEMAGWGQDVMGLALLGRLVIVGRGSEQRFARHTCQPSQATVPEMLLRYLQGYGPATMADFAYWTGLRAGAIRGAKEALGAAVTEVEAAWSPNTYLVCADQLEGLKAKPLPLRLLAKFDPLTMGHKDKCLWLPDEHRTQVFRKAGQVEAVILSQGMAIGTYRTKQSSKELTVTVESLRPFSLAEQEAVQDEAQRLAQAMGLSQVSCSYVSG